MVRPVHQPTQLIPLVHTADMDPVAHADRHALGEIDVMGNKQRATAADVEYEALVT